MSHAAQRSPHGGADPIRVFLAEIQLGIGQSHAGCGDTELGKSVQSPCLALFQVIAGGEIRDLSRNPGLEHGRVESGDAAYRRTALEEALPQSLHAQSDGSDRAGTGDYDSPKIHKDLRQDGRAVSRSAGRSVLVSMQYLTPNDYERPPDRPTARPPPRTWRFPPAS